MVLALVLMFLLALVTVIMIGLLKKAGAPAVLALVVPGVFSGLVVRKRRVRWLTAGAYLTAREIRSAAVVSKQIAHNIIPFPGPISRPGAPETRLVGESGAEYADHAREGNLANRSFTI